MIFDENSLVDRIYEASLVPTLWPNILADLTVRCDGVGAVLMTSGHRGAQMVHSPEFDAVMTAFIEEGWPMRNQRFARATARRLEGFLTEQDLFTPDEIQADPMFTDFLLPRGLGSEIGTIIAMPTGDDLVLTVQRRFRNVPVSAAMVAEANAIRPHIARSVLLSARIGLDRARAAAEVLRAVGLPAAVLASGGRPLAVNDLFEVLMPAITVERRGRIVLTEPRADALLLDALDRVTETGSQGGTQSIPVRPQDGSAPMIAHLIPIRRSAHDIFVGAASVLLLTPINASRAVGTLVLEGLFDLTPAEIRLCSTLFDGRLSLPEVAESMGLSYHTVKTQLRAVFDKTGTTRQAELVGLLAAMAPRWAI